MRYNFYEIKEKKNYSSCEKEREVFRQLISLLSFKYPTYFEERRLLKLLLDLDELIKQAPKDYSERYNGIIFKEINHVEDSLRDEMNKHALASMYSYYYDVASLDVGLVTAEENDCILDDYYTKIFDAQEGFEYVGCINSISAVRFAVDNIRSDYEDSFMTMSNDERREMSERIAKITSVQKGLFEIAQDTLALLNKIRENEDETEYDFTCKHKL